MGASASPHRKLQLNCDHTRATRREAEHGSGCGVGIRWVSLSSPSARVKGSWRPGAQAVTQKFGGQWPSGEKQGEEGGDGKR